MAIVEDEAVSHQAGRPCSSMHRVRRFEIEGRMVEVWWGMTRGKIEGVEGVRKARTTTAYVKGASKKEGPPAFTTIRSFLRLYIHTIDMGHHP